MKPRENRLDVALILAWVAIFGIAWFAAEAMQLPPLDPLGAFSRP